jgi:hypothetical protein
MKTFKATYAAEGDEPKPSFIMADNYQAARQLAAGRFKTSVSNERLLVVEAPTTQSKPQQMADELKSLDESWGFIVIQGNIALFGPGAPFTIQPKPTYGVHDLNEAVTQGLLRKISRTLADLPTGKILSTFDVYFLTPAKK